jgi:hypothetical protein
MTSRLDAIVRLLQTRDYHLPALAPRQAAPAGFIHDTYAPTVCPVCEGVDSINCTGCGGRGEVERHRNRDPYAKSETVTPYGLDGERHRAGHERDRQIDRLGRQTRPAAAIDEDDDAARNPYPWERERRRMYQRYDYAALDRTLDQLRLIDDGAYRALHAVYVYGWLAEASGAVEAACHRGIAYLDSRLPDPLRAPGTPQPAVNIAAHGPNADPRARNQRDQAVLTALNDATPEAVAARFGLSVSQVYRIRATRRKDAA